MNRIRAIFKREYLAFFRTPIGFVLFAIFMVVSGLYFASTILSSTIDIVGELSFLQTFLFVIIPLITMRSFSEDRKNGTEVLLMTSPASVLEIVIAKYLAVFALFLTLTAGTLVHVFITFLYGGVLDMNVLGAYIGFVFIGAMYIAIGVFASSLTENQLTAAIMTFVAIMSLTLIEFLSGIIRQVTTVILSAVNLFGIHSARIDAISASIADGIAWLNPNARIDNLIVGIFAISPLVYFTSATAVFLFLTCQAVKKRRWSQR